MHRSVRLALAILAAAGAAMLAACDTAGEGPPPACEAAPLVERADTLFIAVGDTAALDLEVLFAGNADEPLTFSLVVQQAYVQLRDGRAIVAPVTEGVRTFEVRAATACGVVAEAVVTVSALPSGTSCPAPPAAPVGSVRVPTGGAIVTRRIWGPDGVVNGLFHFDSPADVDGGDGLVQASVVFAMGSRSLRIVPGNQTGMSTLMINATDACLRPVAVAIPLEVVDAPHCVLVEPGYADFFPLDVGRNWAYRYERGGSPGTGGGTSWMETGDETWEVTAATSCDAGYREYTLIVTRMPDSGPPVTGTIVLGSINGVVRPLATADIGWWLPAIPRHNPPDPPQLTFTQGVGSPSTTLVTVEREVGIVSTNAESMGSGHSREYYERTLSGY